MKVYIAREYGAGNSAPVFDAFEEGLKANGDEIAGQPGSADVLCIWSFLFSGRMVGNRNLYHKFKNNGKKVVILEVGALRRGLTWKVGINGINNKADWITPFEQNRISKFDIDVKDWKKDGEFITICSQRTDSQQWVGLPSAEEFYTNLIQNFRNYSQRPIVVRPHPRDKLTNWSFLNNLKDVFFDVPQKVENTYDSFNHNDIFSRSKIIYNYSSGPSIQSVLEGIPVVCSPDSLAYDMRTEIENIESPNFPDREEWLQKLSHTEWTVEEMRSGIVWKNLRHLV